MQTKMNTEIKEEIAKNHMLSDIYVKHSRSVQLFLFKYRGTSTEI